jgi:formylglycine-generating enzyme required for sulfatase activity
MKSVLSTIIFSVLTMGCQREVGDTGAHSFSVPEYVESTECGAGYATGNPIGTVDCQDEKCMVSEGEFWMGSSFSEAECPIHQVTLSSFWIDQYEVTLAEWQACASQGRCEALPTHCLNPLYDRPDYTNRFPAICVTWSQASNYCQGIGGRLPTEAEWEKSAAGTQAAKWAWGESSPDCSDANFRLASLYCAPGVKSVGWYVDSVSSFGLYDVNGNVFEWTADWYDADFYASSPAVDPFKNSGECTMGIGNPPAECDFKVLRGGSYNTTESTIRNASRSFGLPTLVDSNIGFRCAYDVN